VQVSIASPDAAASHRRSHYRTDPLHLTSKVHTIYRQFSLW